MPSNSPPQSGVPTTADLLAPQIAHKSAADDTSRKGLIPMEKTQTVATKAGVWIDHKEAIVVLITDAGQKIRKFNTGMKPAGGKSRSKKYTPNDFIAEDRRERKLADERKKVYEEVLACTRGADSLLILGPGEAKGELNKHIQAKKLRGLMVEMEITDKMTDRQLAAKVGEHFTKTPASKSVAPKGTVQARSGKRTTRTGRQVRR